jgi:bleomycin hydrolase
MLVIFLGEPPSKFSWEYYSKPVSNKKSKKGGENLRNNINMKMLKNKSSKPNNLSKDKHNKYNIVENISPVDFYKKYSGFNVDNMITLINYPGKPMNKLYNVETSNNMIKGMENNYVNAPIELLKLLTKISIDDDCAVWFACDVGKYMSQKLGVLDKDAFNIKDTIGFDYDMSKEDMLKYRVSEPSHAMIFKGYTMNNLEVKGKDIKLDVNKWLVENSWGDMTKKHGNFTMSDKWFSEYVYEIMVDKKYLSKKILNVLKTKPVVLPMWDPFGNLLQ